MGRESAIVGLGLLAWQVATPSAALAAETTATSTPTVTAVIDASGRVVPVQQKPTPREGIGRTKAVPCGAATALSADAAKGLVTRVAAEEGFYPEFVLSVAKIESRYVSTALSGKGAYGLMQLMPDTAQRFNVDLCDPAGNVRGGIRFLRTLHARYRNPFFILAAYNAGEDAVRRSRGVPPYPETVRFVADVMNDFYAWPNPAGGSKGSAVLAAVVAPGIVEINPSPAAPSGALGPSESGSIPSATTATPQWRDGFVMHVD